MYAHTFYDYKDLAKHTEIDILFLGSSHSYTSYNPLIITNKTNLISYNLGAPSLNIANTDILLKEVLKYTTPKLVVLDVFEGTLRDLATDKDKGFQLDALDRIPNTSLLKLESVRKNYSLGEYTGVLFPLLRNHNKWNRSFRDAILNKGIYTQEYYYSKGYRGYQRQLENERKANFKNFNLEPREAKQKYSITKQAKDHLINTIRMAKESGANVLIVTSPDLRISLKKDGVASVLNEIANANGAEYVDLNDFYNEMNLSVDDFMDTQHLNLQGGTKVSEFLGDFIHKKYAIAKTSSTYLKEYQDDYDDFILFHTEGKKYSHSQKLDAALNDFVAIDTFFLDRNKGKHTLKLSVTLSENSEDWLGKYNMALKIIPKETKLDQVDEKFIARGWKFDKFDFKLLLEPGKRMYEFNFNTRIRDIQSVEISLYDRNVYQGIIGNKVSVENVQFILDDGINTNIN